MQRPRWLPAAVSAPAGPSSRAGDPVERDVPGNLRRTAPDADPVDQRPAGSIERTPDEVDVLAPVRLLLVRHHERDDDGFRHGRFAHDPLELPDRIFEEVED